MRVFTIYLCETATSPDRDAVIIKEGFCWPAFFFGPFWALYHRMWFACLGIMSAAVLIVIVQSILSVDPLTLSALIAGAAALVGFHGNDWRCSALLVRGWKMSGLSAAADRDAAFRRFVDLHPEAMGRTGPYPSFGLTVAGQSTGKQTPKFRAR
jgi:hypothetical protein